jgi:hypothetical protein
MTRDKIIDEYLKGKLPFSELYRKASEDEVCPDKLSARVLAGAARRDRPRSVYSVIKRLQRAIHSRVEQHRILIGSVLPIAVAVATTLLFVHYMRAGDSAESISECRSVTAVGPGSDRGIPTSVPERWLDQVRQLRRQGRIEEADAALAEFRQHYPDYPLGALQPVPD